MLFTPKNVARTKRGEKTQTRRLAKPGDCIIKGTVFDAKGHRRWSVGKTYAMCPGRGKTAEGRIRIKSIRGERLHRLTLDDLGAEGFFVGVLKFQPFIIEWDTLHRPGFRWPDNPKVWVLGFERVRA